MKFEFSGQIIEKMFKYKISVPWEPSSMRTDRHDEANSLFFFFLQFCKIVYKLKCGRTAVLLVLCVCVQIWLSC